jgi:hypothetical protein
MLCGRSCPIAWPKFKLRLAVPDAEKEFKITTSYGRVILTQKAAPAALTEPDNTLITGINLVTLTARWEHAGVPQSKQIQFYVYRSG